VRRRGAVERAAHAIFVVIVSEVAELARRLWFLLKTQPLDMGEMVAGYFNFGDYAVLDCSKVNWLGIFGPS
jgi:hypothetical protein